MERLMKFTKQQRREEFMTTKVMKIDENLDRALALVADAAFKSGGIQMVPHFNELTKDFQGEKKDEFVVILFDEAKEKAFVSICDSALRYSGWQIKSQIDLLQAAVEEE